MIGIVLIAVGGRDRRQHIPFGPYLAAGTMTFVLAGDQLVSWWRGLGPDARAAAAPGRRTFW